MKHERLQWFLCRGSQRCVSNAIVDAPLAFLLRALCFCPQAQSLISLDLLQEHPEPWTNIAESHGINEAMRKATSMTMINGDQWWSVVINICSIAINHKQWCLSMTVNDDRFLPVSILMDDDKCWSMIINIKTMINCDQCWSMMTKPWWTMINENPWWSMTVNSVCI